jgi:hypothetical protein
VSFIAPYELLTPYRLKDESVANVPPLLAMVIEVIAAAPFQEPLVSVGDTTLVPPLANEVVDRYTVPVEL